MINVRFVWSENSMSLCVLGGWFNGMCVICLMSLHLQGKLSLCCLDFWNNTLETTLLYIKPDENILSWCKFIVYQYNSSSFILRIL